MRRWAVVVALACALGGCGDGDPAGSRPTQEPVVENQPSAPAPDDFTSAVRRVIGDDLVVVRGAPGQVTIETLYTRDQHPIRADAVPAPSEPKLRRGCDAVHRVDRSVIVVILEGDEQTPLLTCPPES